MKKSWHPQRMDNQEKVWKKEEAAKKERQKLMELKRQMDEERALEGMQKRGEDTGVLKKKKDRLDWMYQQPEVNEEDYLLGKKIDKAIMEHQETKAKEAVTGGPSLTVDMSAKVKEDPLFAIKKQEMSHKKALMNNPMRMKQLQMMLKAQVAAKEKLKKGKKMKGEKRGKEGKKKRRKKSRRSSDDSDSNSSEDERRQKKKKRTSKRKDSSDSEMSEEEQRRGRRKEKRSKQNRDSNDSDSAEERRRDKRKGKRSKQKRDSDDSVSGEERRRDRRKREERSRQKRDSSHESDDRDKMRRLKSSHSHKGSSEAEPRRVIPPGYGLIGGKKAPRRQRESSSDSDQGRSSHRHQDKHRDTHHDRHDRHGDKRGEDGARYTERRRSRSPDRRQHRTKPKKLDADELERRRAEMMENAKWRDEQRKDRVSRYNAEEHAEAEQEKRKTKDAKFLDPIRVPTNSSVEDRIKRNVFSIQRTSAALDKNFARR